MYILILYLGYLVKWNLSHQRIKVEKIRWQLIFHISVLSDISVAFLPFLSIPQFPNSSRQCFLRHVLVDCTWNFELVQFLIAFFLSNPVLRFDGIFLFTFAGCIFSQISIHLRIVNTYLVFKISGMIFYFFKVDRTWSFELIQF